MLTLLFLLFLQLNVFEKVGLFGVGGHFSLFFIILIKTENVKLYCGEKVFIIVLGC